jgi:quercetin dioxygenase-like cupin family protein
MKKYKLGDMVNGWLVGNFEPSIFKTQDFEVGYHKYDKGCETQNHYHKLSTEINVVTKGDVEINGERFIEGEVFVIDPYMVSESKFHEDTHLIVIRTSSNTADKYLVG